MSVKCTSLVWQLPISNQSMKLVLLALADNANDEGECWPGLERIQIKCCYKSIRGVQLLINKMVKLNYLKVEDRFRKDGRQTSNLYTLNLKYFNEVIHRNNATTLNASSPSPRTPVQGHPERQFIPPPEKSGILPNENNDLQKVSTEELSVLTNSLTNRGRSKKMVATLFPSNFEITKEHRDICSKYGLDIEINLEKFKTWYKGKRKSDWENNFKLWLLRASEIKNKYKNSSKQVENVTRNAVNHMKEYISEKNIIN